MSAHHDGYYQLKNGSMTWAIKGIKGFYAMGNEAPHEHSNMEIYCPEKWERNFGNKE